MIQFVRLTIQLLRGGPDGLLGFGVGEHLACCLLQKPVDHAVWFHAGRTEEHQKVIGCRVADARNATQLPLDALDIAEIDPNIASDAVGAQSARRLPHRGCLEPPTGRCGRTVRRILVIAELACPSRNADGVYLANKRIERVDRPVTRGTPGDNASVDTATVLRTVDRTGGEYGVDEGSFNVIWPATRPSNPAVSITDGGLDVGQYLGKVRRRLSHWLTVSVSYRVVALHDQKETLAGILVVHVFPPLAVG